MFGLGSQDRQEMASLRRDIDMVAGKQSAHEAVCAERQKNILETLGTLKSILLSVTGFVFVTMLAVIGVFIKTYLMHQ